MSIKGFHIVFVTVSTLLCLFLALWAFVLAPEVSTMSTIAGVIGILGTLGMPIYGVCFWRKVSKIHI
jgi:hypothetical protein